MYLKKIDINEFKRVIFTEYKKLFPKDERKPYIMLKETYNNGITDIIEIIEEDKLIGFAITNYVTNNPCVQLDYFAIFPKYQHKGYGTNAIKLLKEMYKDYDGIFIEIEKVGNGKNDEENQIRQRRAKFYEELGFCKMGFDLDLYNVIYSAYISPCTNIRFSDEKAIKYFFDIYNATTGQQRVRANCKVITNLEK